jgi:rod shape-determining protein MreD
VVFNALLHGCYHGAKLGFVFGLVEDVFIGKFIGLNALTKMLTGYLVGMGENKVFKENLLIPVFGLFTATFLNNILYVFLAGLAGVERNLAFYVWDVTLPTALYNACLAPLFYGKFYHSATKGYLRLSRY